MTIGRRAASATEVRPPLACITSSGWRSPSLAQPLLELLEVGDHLGADVGGDGRRRRPLVLTEDWCDVAGEGGEQAGA